MEHIGRTAGLIYDILEMEKGMEKIKTILGIDHVGYAVKNLHSAKKYFGALGFEFGIDIEDVLRSVEVAVGQNCAGGRIELIAPVGDRKSPIDGYLQKMGSTPYHLCYNVENMEKTVEELLEMGFTMLEVPAPSVPLGGMVCFMYSCETGILELVDYGHGC